MKLISPMFFGEIGDACVIRREGFVIKKILKLVIKATTTPENDIVNLPGVCCVVSKNGKEALIQIGLSERDFHLVESFKDLYFIDVDAKGKGIEIYHGTKIKIDNKKCDVLMSLININQSKIKEL